VVKFCFFDHGADRAIPAIFRVGLSSEPGGKHLWRIMARVMHK